MSRRNNNSTTVGSPAPSPEEGDSSKRRRRRVDQADAEGAKKRRAYSSEKRKRAAIARAEEAERQNIIAKLHAHAIKRFPFSGDIITHLALTTVAVQIGAIDLPKAQTIYSGGYVIAKLKRLELSFNGPFVVDDMS